VSKDRELLDDWITEPLANQSALPQEDAAGKEEVVFDPLGYQRYLLAFSGGKDSLALLLHLLDIGVAEIALNCTTTWWMAERAARSWTGRSRSRTAKRSPRPSACG